VSYGVTHTSHLFYGFITIHGKVSEVPSVPSACMPDPSLGSNLVCIYPYNSWGEMGGGSPHGSPPLRGEDFIVFTILGGFYCIYFWYINS
jgi:hypothetical protein